MTANAGTSFGWFVNCTDCINGAATATITNFVAQPNAVPEPVSLAPLGVGLAGLGFSRRKRQCQIRFPLPVRGR